MKIQKYSEIDLPVGNKDEELIFNHNQQGQTITSEIYVQIPSNVTYSVIGFESENDSVGVPIKIVDFANFKIKNNAAEAGYYMALVGGFCKVKLSFVSTAAGKAFIKWVY